MEFSIFLIGLIFGSFLGMLVYRIPLGISLINPKRSVCPSCNDELKWFHNLPLVSFVILKGKCSNCNTKISIHYPIIELTTALVTLFVFLKFGLTFEFIITTILFYTLITLSAIDFKYKAVPDYLLILALVIAMITPNFSFKDMFIFAGGFVLLELFVTYYIQNIKAKLTKNEDLRTQRAMGEGDIPISAIIGGILGIKLGIVAIFLGAIFAIIPAILNITIKKDIETPFIPFLSLSLFVVFMFDTFFINLLGKLI